MKIVSHQQFARSSWWQSTAFRLTAAFLLGVPVGFLFRPLENPPPPIPPILSLWEAWLFPVLLLIGVMWGKAIYVLVQQRESISIGEVVIIHIVLLCALFFLVCGIAPIDQLKQIHLYLDTCGPVYTLINPFIVGLATAFIFNDSSKPSFAPGRAILISCVGWTGTLTLFLVLVITYAHVVQRAPIPYPCRWFCNTDPTTLILNTAPIWIGIGLLLALIGGITGGQLSHMLLSQRKR